MSECLRIVVAESTAFAPSAAAILKELGEVSWGDLDRNSLLASVGGADVLWVRLRNRIDAEVLSGASRLRIIATPTTGLSHIDLEEAQRRGVDVLSLRGEQQFLMNIRATAEHTIGLILSLLRRVHAAVRHVGQGGWNRDLFQGRELFGKTAGIVGYGRLGRIVARYLNAFGCLVLATDPYVDSCVAEGGVLLVRMEELLGLSDVVSLHASLSSETEGFFGRSHFEAMKPGAWFVNTARGELIDEAALLDALVSGHLAGAALDVIRGEHVERAPENPLLAYAARHDNIIITPHIGGCTAESMEKTEIFLAGKVRERLLTVR